MDVRGEGKEEGGGGDNSDENSPVRMSSPLTIPKSSSFSPKVTRPKLPPCAGSRSPSRSKTDPGREEIKAILEDIKNLKKIDFKTFIRPRNFGAGGGGMGGGNQGSQHPRGYATLPFKSQSTTTSPAQTPRIGSPTSDDPRITRDRSRSLKMLTDRLKNKSGKLLSEHAANQQSPDRGGEFQREGSVPQELLRVSHGPSPDSCSVGRVEEEEEEEEEGKGEREMTELVSKVAKVSTSTVIHLSPQHSHDSPFSSSHLHHHQDHRYLSPQHSLDSLDTGTPSRTDTPDIHIPHSREQTPDSDVPWSSRKPKSFDGGLDKPPESDDDGTGSGGGSSLKGGHDHKGDHRHHHRVHRSSRGEQSIEDEGVSDMPEREKPAVSIHTYHPNKQFMNLRAMAPPKRRTGMSTLTTSGRVQAMFAKSAAAAAEEGDDASRQQRYQRRSEVASPVGPHKVTPALLMLNYYSFE
jgi:hypothetical protein